GAAAEDIAEQRKRGRHGLGQQIEEDLDDEAADGKLRIVERAADRQVQINLAARILQQRNGQGDRQGQGVRALHLLPQRQLVEEDVVLGAQLALLDEVVQVHRELALLDRIA